MRGLFIMSKLTQLIAGTKFYRIYSKRIRFRFLSPLKFNKINGIIPLIYHEIMKHNNDGSLSDNIA